MRESRPQSPRALLSRSRREREPNVFIYSRACLHRVLFFFFLASRPSKTLLLLSRGRALIFAAGDYRALCERLLRIFRVCRLRVKNVFVRVDGVVGFPNSKHVSEAMLWETIKHAPFLEAILGFESDIKI